MLEFEVLEEVEGVLIVAQVPVLLALTKEARHHEADNLGDQCGQEVMLRRLLCQVLKRYHELDKYLLQELQVLLDLLGVWVSQVDRHELLILLA